jgi:multidrug efflux pump subunit AcrB
MSLASFSIKQKVLINLITFGVLIAGTIMAINMRRDAFPEVNSEIAFITTIYPGASPHEVEKLITNPIEDEIKNVNGIDTFSSVSREGTSFISIQLEANVSNKDKVINDITRAADKVDLPSDAEDPEVRELIFEGPLIEISFTGNNISEKKLRKYVKDFKNIIKNINGIGSIGKVGYNDEEISIEIDPKNLKDYYISLAQIIQSVKRQHINLPGGKLTSGSKELIIRTVGEMRTADEFKDIIIRTNNDGKHICIKDVAKVKKTFEDQDSITKTNGKISINLLPRKKKKGDVITITDQIKKEVEKYRKVMENEASITLINDMSFYVKRRLNTLSSNGIIGLILLIIILLLFLNVRVAFVTALGIPFAFLSALMCMSFFGVTLNLITMFGLIIVLGMIVDDAIIIAESAYRHIENGMSPEEAAIMGTIEVAKPVTITILTTIAAFLPLMFISGILGKFLRSFPMGVIFCLAASLFEALIILPSHLAEWVKPLRIRPKQNPDIKSNEEADNTTGWFKHFRYRYGNFLKFSLKKRYLMCFAALIVLIGAIFFAKYKMPFKLFPTIVEIFVIRIETEQGSSLKETNRVISKIEKIVTDMPEEEIENLTTAVGFSGNPGGNGPFDKHGSTYAQSVIYLTPEQKRERNADTIIDEIKRKIEEKKIDNIKKFTFEKMAHGLPVGKPIAVEIKGNNYKTLVEISKKIQKYLKTVNSISSVKDNYELNKEEIQIVINKKEAARLGLDVLAIAQTIRFAFKGGVATTLRKGDEDIDVIVRLPEKHTQNIKTLKNLTIPNNRNRLIALNRMAIFSKAQGIKTINHKDGERTVTITAIITAPQKKKNKAGKTTIAKFKNFIISIIKKKNKMTSVEANKKIIEKFKNIPKEYPGYHIKCGGEFEDTTKSIKSMVTAFLIGFVFIYIILASYLRSYIQPLIIMTPVPFGLIGVIAALFLHGQPVSLMAMFGMVGLSGVVVNDSLILVDFINKQREKAPNIMQAVITAGKVRLRPILLTSITTVVALMPLIYGKFLAKIPYLKKIGGEEPFVQPSALAMGYGLIAATFLTLIIVPCVYLIVEDIKKLGKDKKVLSPES